MVLLGPEGVADTGPRRLVALHRSHGIVGGVHLVDLKSLPAPRRLEVLGRGADHAEHAQMVAGMRALGEGDRAEEAGDVRVPLVVGDVGERQVLLRGLALAGQRRLEVLRRHRPSVVGLRRAAKERVLHGADASFRGRRRRGCVAAGPRVSMTHAPDARTAPIVPTLATGPGSPDAAAVHGSGGGRVRQRPRPCSAPGPGDAVPRGSAACSNSRGARSRRRGRPRCA